MSINLNKDTHNITLAPGHVLYITNAPTALIVKTVITASDNTLYKKTVTYNNAQSLKTLFNKHDVPKAERDLIRSLVATNNTAVQNISNAQKVRNYINANCKTYAQALAKNTQIVKYATQYFNTVGAAKKCVHTNTRKIFNIK